MSFMVLGSMMEADRRLREHEIFVRNQKKVLRDAEVWRRYEEDYSQQSQSTSQSTLSTPSRRRRSEGDDGIRREED